MAGDSRSAAKEKHHHTGLFAWLLTGCHHPNRITADLSAEIPGCFYFYIHIYIYILISIFFPWPGSCNPRNTAHDNSHVVLAERCERSGRGFSALLNRDRPERRRKLKARFGSPAEG